MRIKVQTSFTTVVSEKLVGYTEPQLFTRVEQAIRTSSILTITAEDGSLVILTPQLLVNSVVTILVD